MLPARRDASQRARPRRRLLPRAADHRGVMRTIHELTDAYRRGETTPSEATDAYLSRIAKLDDKAGAYLTVTADRAHAAARAAAARYRPGPPPAPPARPPT